MRSCAASPIPPTRFSHYGACQWLVGDLAETAAGVGRAAEDAPLIAELAADLRDHPTPAVRYSVLYADAMLASDETALARFEAALAADPGGSPLAEARLRLAYGSWLRRRPGAARRPARPPGSRRNGGPLTPQELRIAQLAARGLSNREIGEQLFLSTARSDHACTTCSPNSGSPRGPTRQRAQTITTGEGGTATSAPRMRHRPDADRSTTVRSE